MGRTRSTYGAVQKYIWSLVGKPEGKRTLRRSRRRWENNIKMDLMEMGCDLGEWIELAEDRDQ